MLHYQDYCSNDVCLSVCLSACQVVSRPKIWGHMGPGGGMCSAEHHLAVGIVFQAILQISAYLCSSRSMGSVKLTVSMVISTLRTLPKKSVMRTLPGSLRKRSVRWPGVDTHWLLGQTLNCGRTQNTSSVWETGNVKRRTDKNVDVGSTENKQTSESCEYLKYFHRVLSGVLATGIRAVV